MQRATSSLSSDQAKQQAPEVSRPAFATAVGEPVLVFTPAALMNEGQAAEYLSVSVRTLQNWRVSGRGPVFCKLSGGKAVRYRRADLDAFIERDLVASTSEADAKRATK